jgi:protease I
MSAGIVPYRWEDFSPVGYPIRSIEVEEVPMAGQLSGKTIAFFAANEGVEQVELTVPWERLREAGATVEMVSLEPGRIQMVNHLKFADTFPVDKTVRQAEPARYDGLVLPGGVANPDLARMKPEAVAFVKAFFDTGKPVAAICHAPWMLVEADVVRGRTITSWPSLRTDIRNAGGAWVDQEVVVEKGLVTSRRPADLDAFCAAAIQEFAEGAVAHGQERRSA